MNQGLSIFALVMAASVLIASRMPSQAAPVDDDVQLLPIDTLEFPEDDTATTEAPTTQPPEQDPGHCHTCRTTVKPTHPTTRSTRPTTRQPCPTKCPHPKCPPCQHHEEPIAADETVDFE